MTESKEPETEEQGTVFEQCPLCESYGISLGDEGYSCIDCGLIWTASTESE